MMKISFPISRFQFKVTIAFLVSMLVVIGLSDLLIYQFVLRSHFNDLRGKLKVIAQTAALMIDPSMVQQVPLNQNGVNTPAFHTIAEQLNKIRTVNPGIRYIYTMAKTSQPGEWQFVVDPDAVVTNFRKDVPTSFPGDRYNAARFPEMLKAFDDATADTQLERDEWGSTLSGYAPIRDAAGRAVAILGVDIMADDVLLLQQRVRERVIFLLLLGVLVSLIMGTAVSYGIAEPIQRLVQGTRHLARGNFQHRIKIHGNDEIGELARHFNQMAKNLGHSRQKLLSYFVDVVKSFVNILEARDHYTRGHSEAVAQYATKIAYRMGFDEQKIDMFYTMAILHDIGKLGVRDSILHKTDKLTDEEWNIIKQHPVIGHDILKPVFGKEKMLAAVRGHHERYDGKGYPDQLAGDQIDIFTAILSVADAYDAMTSARAYRSALSKEKAMEQLVKNRGTQFHPQVVDVFLQILKE